MADNPVKYGFRLVKMRSGFAHGGQQNAWCISNAAFTSGVLTAGSLRPGDPIVRLASGAVNIAQGVDQTPGDVLGVVVGIKQYYDTVRGGVTALGNAIPSALVYGTNLDLQSQLVFIPAEAGVWAIQSSNNTTATTRAAYEAFIGENCNHIFTATTGLALTPKLDITSHATTATLQWRIVDIPNTNQQDFSGANVDIHVICNRPQQFTGATTMWQGI